MQNIDFSPSQSALFLDFDGALVNIAPHPSAVLVPPSLVGILTTAYRRLGGAIAIVSGRCMAEIDMFLAPLVLPVAGEHGAQWRNAEGDSFELDKIAFASDLEPALQAAKMLVKQNNSLFLERKTVGFALHYRMAPALYTLCWNTLLPLVQHSSKLALIRGKYVMEVVPSAVDKGTAISRFMQLPPFHGRTPLFFGDDVTDEAGFAAVQAVCGYGVKVGAGPTVALHRCPNPAALRAWLEQIVTMPQARCDVSALPIAHRA
jgi:trehalose 6-phosphate phosphatase